MATTADAIRVLTAKRSEIHQHFGSKVEKTLGSRLDSDDLFQCVSMKVIKNLNQFRGQTDDQLGGWIFAIAENTYKSVCDANIGTQRRSVKSEHGFVGAGDSTRQGISKEYRPDVAAEIKDECRVLMRRLKQLPKMQAEAVRLQYINGLKSKEIAERLGVTEGAARNLVSRGLKSIREKFSTLPQE